MDIFDALSQQTRRSIVEMLAAEGPLSATEISNRFEVSPPAISQHLKILREAEVVLVEKRGQQRIYRVNPQAVHELQSWVQQVSQLWNQRFDALDQLLLAEKSERKEQPDDEPN